MRLLLALVASLAGMHLSVAATLTNPYAAARVAVVTAHTVAGARCSLADSVSDVRLHGTATRSGKVTWRWRPSVWAHGIDNVTVRCAKGAARRSATTFFLVQTLAQINVLRHYAVHLVYWAPDGSISADVPPAVMQLETDVKASLDAGATNNPFAIPRAYGDSLGPGDPRIASIDATVDKSPYPPPAKGYCHGVSMPCMGNPNLAAEVERLGRQHGWLPGNHTLVVVFTGSSVIVCARFTTPNCTPKTEPAGFHDLTPLGYVYADIIMSGDTGSYSPVDYAVALIGHEQNEAVVDPGTSGVEIADPCEQTRFRSIPINGHTYTLPALELPSATCAFTDTP